MGILGDALLNGAADAGYAYADRAQRDRETQQKIDADMSRREMEGARRLELEAQRQTGRIDLLQQRIDANAPGGGGTGGGGGGRGGASKANLAPDAQGNASLQDQYFAARTGQSVADLQKFRDAEQSGDYSGYVQPSTGTIEDSGEARTPGLPVDFESFKQRRRAELATVYETALFAGQSKVISEARSEDLSRKLTGQAMAGDSKAADGVLLLNGSDPRLSAAKVNTEKAQQGKEGALAAQARAGANENNAQASLANRKDPNRGGGGEGGGGSDTRNLMQQNSYMKGLDIEGRALEKLIADTYDKTEKARLIGKLQANAAERQDALSYRKQLLDGGVKSPQANTAPPAAPLSLAEQTRRPGGAASVQPNKAPNARVDKLPSGSQYIGTTKGKPTYETPQGKRFVVE